jgi:hypothetical protein
VNLLILIISLTFSTELFAANYGLYPDTYLPTAYVNGKYWGVAGNPMNATQIYQVNITIQNSKVSGTVIKLPVNTSTNSVGVPSEAPKSFVATCVYDASVNTDGWGASIGKPALACTNKKLNSEVTLQFLGLDSRSYTTDKLKARIQFTYKDSDYGQLNLSADVIKF